MKRFLFWGLLVFTLVLVLLVSCGTLVSDKSVPREQSSTLIINSCFVSKFNGQPQIGWGKPIGKKTVVIPAGTHSLELYNRVETGSRVYEGTVPMTYTFLAGRTYWIATPMSSSRIYGRIVDATTLETALVPNPESPDASPFEGIWTNINMPNGQLIIAGNEIQMLNNGKNLQRGLIKDYSNEGFTFGMDFLFVLGKWTIDPLPQDFTYVYNGATLNYNGQPAWRRTE